MAKQTINIGTAPNDKTGDQLRTAFTKVNDNFTELYANPIVDLSSIDQDILPDTNITYDLGSSTKRFKDLYLSGSTIYLDDNALSDSNGTLTYNNSPVGANNSQLNISAVSNGVAGTIWDFSASRPSTGTDNWDNITYGNGKFVAIQNANTSMAAYSNDGYNWTESTLPYTATWYDITFGNNKFVAITSYGEGYNTSTAASTDGSTWSAYNNSLPLITSSLWSKIAFGNGTFVALDIGTGAAIPGWSGTHTAYSIDGETWALGSSSYNSGQSRPISINQLNNLDRNNYKIVWDQIAFGNGVFIAVANTAFSDSARTSDTIARSGDGITWNEVILPVSADWMHPPVYGNGVWILPAGGGALGNGDLLLYSTDNGTNWTQITLPLDTAWCNPVFGNGYFLLYPGVGEGSYSLMSTDGINWESVEVPAGAIDVTFGKGQFVTIQSNAGTGTYSSAEGTVSIIPPTLGQIDNVTIGDQSPAIGTFTNLNVTGDLTISGTLTVNGETYISISSLQTVVAASTSFADFQTRIAAL